MTNTKRKAVRTIWDNEVEEAKKTNGFKTVSSAIKHALKSKVKNKAKR